MPSIEKYSLLSKIDSGGMAEVFLGEAESLEGFKKRVAIKRILPHMGENKKFIRMFLDEARISLRLNHGNIVQMFDIGKSAAGSYFIVMEYVNGTNLRKVAEYHKDHQGLMPLELAVFIALDICRGLSYAHHLLDRQGQPLQIVHRDVSPPNILLSLQGEVKLVDFGLAKAASQLERTEPGVVKGKYAYLSPEAAWGRDVDHRADIFSCGIILWEMVTGRRLFFSENSLDSIRAIRNPLIPSAREFRPEVSPKLENIIYKALAKEPEDRFQECEEMAEALAGSLFELGRSVTSFDLKRLVEQVALYEETTNPKRISTIDDIVQEELSGFSSLEDISDVVDVPRPNQGTHTGAKPLDPAVFDSDRTSSVSIIEEGSTTANLASSTPTPEPPPEEDSEPSLAQLLEGNSQLINVADVDDDSKKRSHATVIVTVVVALILAATAYYVLQGM